MVVISASILTKQGRVLVARQFIPIPKTRIEGLLAAFPKLISSDIQHTFIETEHVRYVYQPVEQLYLILLTNKSSNIMEDLDTLRLLAKLIPEYCGGQTQDHVIRRVYELIAAFDEVISIGHKENVTVQQIKTFTEMDSHEEKLQKIILESKINEAKDEARRIADSIDKKNAELKKVKEEGRRGGGGGGSFGSSDSYEEPVTNRRTDRPSYERPSSDRSTSSREEKDETPKNKPKASAASGKTTKGMQLSKSKKTTDDFFQNISKEESISEAVSTGKDASSAAASSGSNKKQTVSVVIEEKVVVGLEKDGGLKKMEIKGEMKLIIYDPDDSKIILNTNGTLKESDGWKCRLHPKINKNAWGNDNILGLQDATKAFPVGSDSAPVILKWRKICTDDSDVPFTLNFWPNVENGESVVSVEYSMDKDITLNNVLVTIPCAASEPPQIHNSDGTYKYDQKQKVLLWNIGTVSPDRKSGSLEFSVPEIDGDSFYPINVAFSSEQTFSGIQVTEVNHAETQAPIEYQATVTLETEQYVIE